MTPIKLTTLGSLNNWQTMDLTWCDMIVVTDITEWEPVHTDIINHIVTMRKIVHGSAYHDAIDLIKRRRGQMFIHSYLYYELDKSVISDVQFDQWALELAQLQNDHGTTLGFHDDDFVDWDGGTGYHLNIPYRYKLIARVILNY